MKLAQPANGESREFDIDGSAPLRANTSIGPAGGSHTGSLEAINDKHTLRARSPELQTDRKADGPGADHDHSAIHLDGVSH